MIKLTFGVAGVRVKQLAKRRVVRPDRVEGEAEFGEI